MDRRPTYEELEQQVRELEKEVGKYKEAEEELRRYQFMIESANDAIFFKDLESRYINANDKTLEAFGLSREDVIGKNDYDLMTDQKEAKKNIHDDQVVFKSGKPTEGVKHMTGSDGTEYWFQAIKTPQFDNDGKVIGLVGIARDITGSKRAEEALRESEDKYRYLSEGTFEAVVWHDEGNIIEANEQYYEMFGYKPEELVGIDAILLTATPDSVKFMREQMSLGHLGPYEVVGMKKDGTEFPMEIRVKKMQYKGKMARMAAIRDLTERKQAEEVLKESEKSYRTLAENLPGMVYRLFLRENNKMNFFNDMSEPMTGYRVEELEHGDICNIDNLILPEDRPLVIQTVKDAVLKGEAFEVEYRIKHKNGDVKYFLERGRPIFGRDSKPLHIDSVILDQTERKRTEEALKRSESSYQEIFNASNEAIFLHDLETGAILDVNLTMCEMFGYTREEAVKLSMDDWGQGKPPYTPDHARRWIRKAIEERPQRFEWWAKRKTGELFWVEVNLKRAIIGGQDRILAFVSDITERKQAEKALRESEEKYRRLVESTVDLVWACDVEGRHTYINQAVKHILGYEVHEALSASAFEHMHIEDRQRVQELFKEAVEQKRGWKGTVIRWQHKDGSERFLETKAQPILDDKGNLVGFSGIDRDITERKQTEEALRNSAEQYRIITSTSMDGFAITDLTGRIIDVNEAYSRMTGYSRDELLKMSVSDIEAMSTPDGIQAQHEKMTMFDSDRFESRHRRKDGRIIDVEISMTFFPQSGHILIFLRDITERKRIEEELLREKNFSDLVLNSLPGIFYLFDEDGNFIRWNKNCEVVTGYTTDEIRRIKPTDFFVGDEKDLIANKIQEVLTVGKSEVEASLVTKDNRKIPYYFTGFRMVIDDKKYVLGIGIDITRQKRAEGALRDSEKRYRVVVEDIPAMICRFLPDGTLSFVNSSCSGFLNKNPEELVGQNFFQFIPEEEQEKVRESFISLNQNMPMTTFELQVIAPDGSIHWKEWTDRALFNEKGQVVEYQSIGRDITEVKLAQEEKVKIQKQLQQAQKMEAIGTLAGGIAHDFNNILGVIFGCTELALFDVPEGTDAYRNLRQVLNAGNRATDLVQQILTFSRRKEMEQKPVRLGIVFKEALKMLRASLPSTIEIRQEIKQDSGMVLTDPTQMHQVLMNLCTNAAHAMREKGGVLKVGFDNVEFDSKEEAQNPDLSPGPYVRLTVGDTGHGMDPAILERIFDPYFTTKEMGDGTGLGLAVIDGIVRGCKGAITVHSEPGKGTAFQVFLPRVDQFKGLAEGEEAAALPAGNERILFVDDEEALVQIGKEMLERLGYEVVAKTSSIEALEIFRTQPDKYDLVITDMTMPKMTGEELAKEFIRIRPDIPIILCTGFSEHITEERAKGIGIQEFIMKPLVIRNLAEKIRNVLDSWIDD